MGINRRLLTVLSVSSAILILYKALKIWTRDRLGLAFTIGKSWDGKDLSHQKAEIYLSKGVSNEVVLSVRAPFYNDPPAPNGPVGQPFPQLWDYEVVEAFFLSDSGKYLEVELCPHGQHIVLMLDGRRNMIKDKLPLLFTSKISGSEWTGTAVIPADYFPPNVSKFNAYAIHGSGDNRQYEAYMAVPGDQPDFHRLEYFANVDFSSVLPAQPQTSSYWQQKPGTA
ncbi:UPF0462 protein C4orf33 homolog isoform X1 [Ruditapes philippinarum]|uniref:UPF0462 protein C4orf33 homolog isoform X1 n=1 Tax=Ruditapes philippinarum TaxID=129788 RepID=UPI00295B5F69|nr:UPF0462 protein C4orf33 homolog isoform X1 [Ruditapes philippinarum]